MDGSDKDHCVAMVKTFASTNDGNVTKCHLLVKFAGYFSSKCIIAKKKDWDKTFSVNVVTSSLSTHERDEGSRQTYCEHY